MLTIKTMPMLLKVVSKLDITPAIERLKKLDIFEDTENAADAMKQLDREKVGVLACELLADFTPQLGKIAEDIPPFVAAYKDITLEEAEKLDAAEVINDIINDDGIVTFFKRALRKKVERES